MPEHTAIAHPEPAELDEDMTPADLVEVLQHLSFKTRRCPCYGSIAESATSSSACCSGSDQSAVTVSFGRVCVITVNITNRRDTLELIIIGL
jgi:hypothetical protein